ncbi:DUF4116 domain-containing protein [Rickettsiales bacterium]|nr:DUF4116 domain-containing protein [Rickettsiales bacterium]
MPEADSKKEISVCGGLSGEKICIINFDPNLTIGDLKSKLKEASNIPVKQQKLVFGNEILSDDHKLSNYLQEAEKYTLTLIKRDLDVTKALEVLEKFGFELQFASDKLKGDKEVVLEVVKKDGLALKFASEELRGDREVVLAAVKQDGYALELVSEKLRGDKEVAL